MRRVRSTPPPVQSPISIGIDLHDGMQDFIRWTIVTLRNKGRKQIKKDQVYNDFLAVKKLTEQQLPVEEFIEVLESLNKKENGFNTTQKLIRILSWFNFLISNKKYQMLNNINIGIIMIIDGMGGEGQEETAN